jgi:hypothetical protein
VPWHIRAALTQHSSNRNNNRTSIKERKPAPTLKVKRKPKLSGGTDKNDEKDDLLTSRPPRGKPKRTGETTDEDDEDDDYNDYTWNLDDESEDSAKESEPVRTKRAAASKKTPPHPPVASASSSSGRATVAAIHMPDDDVPSGKILVYSGNSALIRTTPGNVEFRDRLQAYRLDFQTSSRMHRRSIIKEFLDRFHFELPVGTPDTYREFSYDKVHHGLSRPKLTNAPPRRQQPQRRRPPPPPPSRQRVKKPAPRKRKRASSSDHNGDDFHNDMGRLDEVVRMHADAAYMQAVHDPAATYDWESEPQDRLYV